MSTAVARHIDASVGGRNKSIGGTLPRPRGHCMRLHSSLQFEYTSIKQKRNSRLAAAGTWPTALSSSRDGNDRPGSVFEARAEGAALRPRQMALGATNIPCSKACKQHFSAASEAVSRARVSFSRRPRPRLGWGRRSGRLRCSGSFVGRDGGAIQVLVA